MNVQTIKNAVGTKFGRTGLVLQKHSPEILLGVGLVGMVATVVMASRATLKVEEILKQRDDALNMINEATEVDQKDRPLYSDEDATKDKAVVYVQTGLKFAKLYGPAIGLGVLSVGAILASHGVMAKRQVSLVAAYNILAEGYRSYRERVVEELGADADRNFHLGITEDEYFEKEVGEDGKKVKVKKTQRSHNPRHYSEYSVIYDESNPNFRGDRLMDRSFILGQQNYLNDQLRLHGHVYLNQAYEALGFPHTVAGAIVGWVLRDDPKQMKEEGRDGYVSFGLFDANNDPATQEFMNGTNPSVILDFNVDGIMFDKI